MPIPRKSLRGLQDIRTHSGKKSRTDSTYKLYMRLSALEMERVRLANKRENALKQLREIDARSQELDMEEKALLEALDLPQTEARALPEEKPAEQAAPAESDRQPGGFRLRY